MQYRLVGTIQGKEVSLPLREGKQRLGRARDQVEILLPCAGVSRLHAEIHVGTCGVEIRDLGSRNGVAVNGRAVQAAPLAPGDEIVLGNLALHLDAPSQPWLPDTQEAPARGRTGSRLLRTLVELGQFLVTDEDLEPACVRCLQRVSDLFHFRLACLFVLNSVGEPEVRCTYPEHIPESELQISRSVVDRVIRAGRARLVQDTHSAKNLWRSARLKGIRSVVAAPLLRDGEVIGVLYLDQDDPRRAFGPRHRERLQLLANLVAAKLNNERARLEMRSAAHIQSSFLRQQLEHPDGYEVAVRFAPSELVGGDLYEGQRLPDGRYLYAVGDVAGHGVCAALLMGEVLAILRTLAQEHMAPLALMERLRGLLTARLAPHGFITLFLGALDPASGRLDYVSAGHEPPLLLGPRRSATWLDSTGPPIGMPLPLPLTAASTVLPPGTLFAAWSDGIPEAWRQRPRPPQQYSRERLLRSLRRRHRSGLDEIAGGVFRDVEAFLGGIRAQDDRTILLLRRGE
jgi:serine phosphatase RsbU (regulator of sigma subunit)